MLKKISIIGFVLVLFSSMASATVVRTINDATDTITYSSSLTSTYVKAYWAIEETFSGCTLNSITCPTSSSIICGKSGNILRITGYAQNGILPNAQVTVLGSGTCSITGQWIESVTGNIASSPASFSTGSITVISTCVSMNTILSGIGEWKVATRTMDSLLALIGQYKSNPC